MQIELKGIPVREALHFLGWRGTAVEPELLEQIELLSQAVIKSVHPRAAVRRFALDDSGRLEGTTFCPQGKDVSEMLCGCREAVLLAATLGVQSERMLLRQQACDGVKALLLDAVLSAAIETVCDQAEGMLREETEREGLYLTDRFSPGYGDMPIDQTREILCVLGAEKNIGLTVSRSGVMTPRKSVTAIMGVSASPVSRRAHGCACCRMRERCPLACEGLNLPDIGGDKHV